MLGSPFFRSRRNSLLVLIVTAAISARSMFVFFDDPEGTNLLVTTVAALIVFASSLPLYIFGSKTATLSKLVLGILIQVLFVSVLYVLLR